MSVSVLVPLYNEDPEVLQHCLASMLTQSRRVGRVVVIDDGSLVDYAEVRADFTADAAEAGVDLVWLRSGNGGKRHAQGLGVASDPHADVYVTIDSDGILDPNAVEELMLGFADERVLSVAGVVMAANHRQNLLTRMTDLWFVTGQLVDRSAASTMGAVLVNSGVLAAYRGDLVRDNVDGYLNETFFGRPVEFSDDSMLTLYALAEGRAIQQPTAFAFTMMPATLHHHLRQYLRWMRGAFIRTWWRFRYLPLRSYAYWAHFISWTMYVLSAVIFVALFVVAPATDRRIVPELLLLPVLIGYGQALRYLTVRRSDETFGSQVVTVLLSPVSTLWAFFVLRAVRWYGIATCRRTGWGTRGSVEIAWRQA